MKLFNHINTNRHSLIQALALKKNNNSLSTTSKNKLLALINKTLNTPTQDQKLMKKATGGGAIFSQNLAGISPLLNQFKNPEVANELRRMVAPLALVQLQGHKNTDAPIYSTKAESALTELALPALCKNASDATGKDIRHFSSIPALLSHLKKNPESNNFTAITNMSYGTAQDDKRHYACIDVTAINGKMLMAVYEPSTLQEAVNLPRLEAAPNHGLSCFKHLLNKHNRNAENITENIKAAFIETGVQSKEHNSLDCALATARHLHSDKLVQALVFSDIEDQEQGFMQYFLDNIGPVRDGDKHLMNLSTMFEPFSSQEMREASLI